MAKKLAYEDLVPVIGEDAARAVIALQSPEAAAKSKWYLVKFTEDQALEFSLNNPDVEIKPRFQKKAK